MKVKRSSIDARVVGDVKATGCGAIVPGGTPAGKRTATAKLANTTYPLVSAAAYRLDGSKTWYVVLSTAPQTCRNLFPDADFTATLSVPANERVVESIGVGGLAFERSAHAELRKDSPRELKKPPSPDGDGATQLTLPALRATAGPFGLQLSGELPMLRCGQAG